MDILIALQYWDATTGEFSTPHFLTVEKKSIPPICFTMADMMQKKIRLTYPPNKDCDVSRLSGGYFHPNPYLTNSLP